MMLVRRRRREPSLTRLFTFDDIRLTTECAFHSGRELGFRAAQQLGVAARKYRTYLILSELQRLDEALRLNGAVSQAEGVQCAVDLIRGQFSTVTPAEAAAFARAAEHAGAAIVPLAGSR